MSRVLLKNGEIVTSEGELMRDLLVEDGKIAAILEPGAESAEATDAEVIDCDGKKILPGLIDVHVHFRDFEQAYKEDWESGSRAAVSGGVTSVFDMPNNQPPIVTLENLEEKRKLIAGRSYVNYGIFMGFNGENVDELEKAEGICAVKVYIANSTGNMGVDTGKIRELFEKTKHKIVVHAEDEDVIKENFERISKDFEEIEMPSRMHSEIRSSEAATKAVQFICDLAKDFPGRLHVAHVSCEDEVDVISRYKEYGVTCEVAPHHLLFSEDDYEHLGNFVRMNPPVRTRNDVFAMWKNLKFGIIDIIATDHAPHTIEEKEQPYLQAPSGVPEVEFLLPILLNAVNDEGITFQELLRFCCEGPTKIFNIPNKGKIAEGFDADLVVVDMEREKKIERESVVSKCGWSPYEGLSFKGWPVMTFVNGELKWQEGEFKGGPAGKEINFK